MSGEWIKLELSTLDKPEILRMARILSIDKDAVLGKVSRIWAWFDKNSVDGNVDGVVSTDVDQIAFQIGFAKAMREVHWLDYDDDEQWVSLPNFDRHNGETAKKRALKNNRQAKWRHKKDGIVDTELSTNSSTREEKRREDTNNTDTNVSVADKNNLVDPCPHQSIIDLYHQILPMGLQVRVWNGTRASHLKARWREDAKRQSLEYWERLFNYVAESPFLTGKVHDAKRHPFEITLEWIVSPNNFAKIIEGFYHRGAHAA